MSSLVVRRLDDAVKERLRERAEKHGRSLEAEVREILVEATRREGVMQPEEQKEPTEKGFGTLMLEHFGKRAGLTPAERRRMERAASDLLNSFEMHAPDFEEW